MTADELKLVWTWAPTFAVGAALLWPAVRRDAWGRRFDRPTRAMLAAAGVALLLVPNVIDPSAAVGGLVWSWWEGGAASPTGWFWMRLVGLAAFDLPGSAAVGGAAGLFAAAVVRGGRGRNTR